MLFSFIISFIIIQRLVELMIAKSNENWMRKQGAYEVGAGHYPWMVAMHSAFFCSLLGEVILFDRSLSVIWPLFLGLFVFAQVLRIWCLVSLGKFWNTKIIILPGAEVVRKGPYQWIRHPNYMIVTTELLVLPLFFGAYFTAILFVFINAWMLSVRIPIEEKALKEATNYRAQFSLK